MMSSVEDGPKAGNKSREDFLKAIPLPDDVFLAAAKRAVISAGLTDEVVKILHPDIPETDLPARDRQAIQLNDAAFLMPRKAIANLDAGTGLRLGAADIVPAAELAEAEYAAVRDAMVISSSMPRRSGSNT
jgi:hypothetical protein